MLARALWCVDSCSYVVYTWRGAAAQRVWLRGDAAVRELGELRLTATGSLVLGRACVRDVRL